MRKIQFIFLVCLCIHYVNGQENTITIGIKDSIHSNILNETRELWIHHPDGNSDTVKKREKYPVLYLLDGNSHFYSVVGMVTQLSAVNGNTICPKMIIVGIPNTNRIRDLSPARLTEKSSKLSGYKVENTGGGEAFISFIEKELIPYIDKTYETESYRMFIGHSLGGLAVMNILLQKPELFNAYVAIDPSMWWNDQKLLQKIRNTKFDERYKHKKLFVAIANTMHKGMDTIKVKKDTAYATRHIRAILELNAVLKKDALNNLSYKGKYYKNDTHGSVPFIAEYDALRYIFDFYQIQITKQELMNPKKDVLAKVKNYYQRLSKEFQRNIKPKKYYIEDIANRLMDLRQFEKAEAFFKLNASYYPKDFYVYSCLGDFYTTLGNKEKAIENFKKSNVLHKNPYATDRLAELQEK
ncbi:ferri-bacillibactin esterase BesA [Kordia sp. SMS9]|uniref:alpha/beta hydrolase-fold protein n=1 Tax=Kordia sp. SMS9 TaxID=2282170 RepID=UPI000E0DE2A7|nr:alpha/beta hydrolase-fold protein [Kordia sp. SMS9]AXG72237.1 ferri-bacillibactin esterase BesA [Kordia sp. SMS9]